MSRTAWLRVPLLLLSLISFESFAFSAFAMASEITVSAALSLKEAFTEMGRLYESRHSGSLVRFNFGASGDLLRQLEGGAPVDVLATASKKDMDDAQTKGLIKAGTRADFASNSIVLITPSNSKTSLASFDGLSAPGVKRLAIGNPRTTPIGRYAEDVLAYYRLTALVKDKIVPCENVKQALDYVAQGEVDAAIVYGTDALIRPKEVSVVDIAPDKAHAPVLYPIAIVTGASNESGAADFISLVRSSEGQAILRKRGFRQP